MITSCSWTETKFKQAHSYHAYVGYNNINDMPNQDDDIINNQGDKCNQLPCKQLGIKYTHISRHNSKLHMQLIIEISKISHHIIIEDYA